MSALLLHLRVGIVQATFPALCLCCFLLATTNTLQAATPPAPGWGELGYEPPTAGSYQLPPLGIAADGEVLNEQGETVSLHTLMGGQKYTLLSFIYSNCQDANGCPLAGYVFYRLKALMQEQPELADSLRLLSLSFDPERDTPPVMALYGANFRYAGKKGEWQFLTTAGDQDLQPILRGYKQEIQREITVNGTTGDDYAHLLRIFLIDPELQIRNIYSVGFLHSDLILTDLQTLQLAKKDQTSSASEKSAKPTHLAALESTLSGPGDVKQGYGSGDYQTRTKSLLQRDQAGKAADLYALSQRPPLGLPELEPAVAEDLSPSKIALGRKLFFDRRLSLNDTFSCAMCHIPEQGFTSNEMQTAVGLEGRTVRRNSPSLYNVAYLQHLFHDGREFRLEEQIWSPLLAHNEMANPSVGYILSKINKLPDYQSAFEKVYQQPVTMASLGNALAAYQRTLLSADSAFDRWYYGKQENALSTEAIKGFRLFTGKANCATCHSVGDKAALFTDQQLHNTGIGYRASMGERPAKQRVALAPGVFVDVDSSIIDKVSKPAPTDLGLYEITQNPADRWKYKTPGLRNIALTAPYMHDGSLGTLEAVLEFYNQGGIANPELSPLLRPLNLSEQEIGYLLAFLRSLTGSNVDELVADAFAAPVGDPLSDNSKTVDQQAETAGAIR
ncbi:MAG: cytochrome c peroxidase [Thiolinea sp.]